MNSVEKCAKNVDEAVEAALKELNAKREDVEVEILEKGEKKGFLGLIKGKEAKVKVTLIEKKETKSKVKKEVIENKSNVEESEEDVEKGIEAIKEFLGQMIKLLEVEAEFDIVLEHKIIRITLKGKDIGRLVGAGGHTLESIQLILNAMSFNKYGMSKKVIIDTEEYRKKREDYLKNLAKNTAEKAVRYNKKITLNPMNSFERRIVHAELQEDSRIKTYSIGEEPNRKIVVELR